MLQNLLRQLNQKMPSLRLVLSGLSNLVPCQCLLCGMANPETICADCERQFFSIPVVRCLRCATPLNQSDRYCGQCMSHPPAFSHTITACDYRAPVDQLVLSLKFHHRLAAAPALAKQIALAVTKSESRPEMLIPVPLSSSRLAQRGFNQSLEIARPLARLMHRPLFPQLLHRTRDTTPQTLLHPDQRHANIVDAFIPDEATKDKIRNRHIGVVDDVMTTGATLNEIAACLKRHGARCVTNLVFARTPPH